MKEKKVHDDDILSVFPVYISDKENCQCAWTGCIDHNLTLAERSGRLKQSAVRYQDTPLERYFSPRYKTLSF